MTKSSLEKTTHFYHKPCFEARECVEKCLKSFLEASGKAAPELHSLRTLIDMCGKVDKEFITFRSRCMILQPYQHEARYPELPTYDFTAEMADEAVTVATQVYEIVERKILAIEQRLEKSRKIKHWILLPERLKTAGRNNRVTLKKSITAIETLVPL